MDSLEGAFIYPPGAMWGMFYYSVRTLFQVFLTGSQVFISSLPNNSNMLFVCSEE